MERHRWWVTGTTLLSLVHVPVGAQAAPSSASAEQQQDVRRPPKIEGAPFASYDHSTCLPGASPATAEACAREAKLTLSDGEVFAIRIQKTYPDQFEYLVAGVKKPSEQPTLQRGDAQRDTVIWHVHDAQFGGYVVRIRKAPGRDQASLGEAVLRISVETAEWKVGFGSGFSGTGLTDPFLALRDTMVRVTDDDAENGQQMEARQVLVENRAREDAVDLDLTAMTHVWHSKLPWLAATFGIGLSDAARTRYYFGPSLRAGNKAAITVGVVVGSIEAPPPGVDVGDLVDDANVLKNLSDRNVVRAFVGISYTFIGGADKALAKPFADPGTTPPATVEPQEERADDGIATDTLPDLTLVEDGSDLEGQELTTNMRLGDSLTITVRASRGGTPVGSASINWQVEGASGRLMTAAESTEETGLAAATVEGIEEGSFEVVAKTSDNPSEAQTVSVKVTVENHGGG